MTGDEGQERKSKAAEPVLINDERERAEREAANGLAQFDRVLEAPP
jgi:hypothetical protein